MGTPNKLILFFHLLILLIFFEQRLLGDDSNLSLVKGDEEQKKEDERPTKSKERNCNGRFANLLSPLCSQARPIFIYGTLLTTGLYLSRADTSNKVRINTIKEKPLRDSANVGSIIGLGFLNASYMIHQGVFNNNIQNAELMAEASAYSALITWVLKHSINEGRPGNPKDTRSFPSGHTSLAFAFASVVGARHGVTPGIISYLLASFIAYSRIHEDYHYLHDVVFGATIGMSYGLGIHYNHQEGMPYWFMPMPSPDGKGLQFVMQLPF